MNTNVIDSIQMIMINTNDIDSKATFDVQI